MIGLVLITPELLGIAADCVTPEDFGSPENSAVWDALLRLDLDEAPIDVIALRGRLAELGTLEMVGGNKALAGYLAGIPAATEASIRYHAKRVSEAGRHRRIARAVGSLAGQADDLTAEEIEAALEALLSGTGAQTGVCDREEVAAAAMKALEDEAAGALAGIATGIPDLDGHIRHGGFRPGQVIYVGARTSWGKSALCLGFAENAAAKGHKALVFPLEMAPEDMEIRRYVADAMADTSLLRSWRPSEREATLAMLRQSKVHLAGRPLWFARTAAWSVAQIRATCRRQKQRPGLDVAVVDYLGLVEYERSGGSLYEQTTKASKALKRMAMELGIVVLAAVQLNREAAKGGPGGKARRPSMADFRDSGAIEQDCDIGILIHQEDSPDGIRDGEAVLIVGKQRNGWRGDVAVRWRSTCARFEGMAQAEEMPPANTYPRSVPDWHDD